MKICSSLKRLLATVGMKLNFNMMCKDYSRELFSTNKEVLSILLCLMSSMENLKCRKVAETIVSRSTETRKGSSRPHGHQSCSGGCG